MAVYVAPSIRVSISETCVDKAYYVYFGELQFSKDGTLTLIGINFNKRFKIDDSTFNNTFPNLYTHSYYDKDRLQLNTFDAYIGSKITNNLNTIISIIYPNDFIDSNIKYMIVTGEKGLSKTNFSFDPDIQYNYPLGHTSEGNTYKIHNYITSEIGQDNWLYVLDCQKIYTKYKTYIVHFYIQHASETSKTIEDIIVNLHESDDTAHTNMAKFANDISTEKIYGTRLLESSLDTTNSKTNGLMTANPMQHRMFFYGVPYGYKSHEKFEYITQNNLDFIIKNSYDVQKIISEYYDKSDEFGNYLFGKDQINHVDPPRGALGTSTENNG